MDTKIFNQLLETHRDRVYSYALYCLRDPEDAEDVTQEAFLRLWRSGPDTESSRLTAWLQRVVHNLCIDQTRRRKTVRSYFGRPDTDAVDRLTARPGVDNDPEQALQLDHKQRLLLDAMATLPPETRSVMMMHYFQGLTLVSIAELLGKKTSTVKVQVHRARQALRRILVESVAGRTAEKRETG